METQLTRVILDIQLEQPVADLAAKVAGRAYTIQGVKGVEILERVEDLHTDNETYSITDVEQPIALTLFQRLKAFLRGD